MKQQPHMIKRDYPELVSRKSVGELSGASNCFGHMDQRMLMEGQAPTGLLECCQERLITIISVAASLHQPRLHLWAIDVAECLQHLLKSALLAAVVLVFGGLLISFLLRATLPPLCCCAPLQCLCY